MRVILTLILCLTISSASASVSAQSTSTRTSESAPARPKLQLHPGFVFGVGAGLTLVGIGGVLRAPYLRRGEDFRDTMPGTLEHARAERDWDRWSSPAISAAAGGAAVMAVSCISLLLDSPRKAFPWWASLIAAGAASGLIAWGAVDFAQGDKCTGNGVNVERALCAQGLEQRNRGALILGTSMPFVAIPITQGIRWLLD